MALPSGADIRLLDNTDYEFMLAQDVQGHYKHRWVPRYAQSSEIEGMQGKRHARANRIVWSLDDFQGGTGARVWNPFEPDVYRQGTVNSRIPGQFSGRPTRALVSTTLNTGDTSKEPRLAIGDGALFYGGEKRVGFTLDGTTWTICDTGARTGISNLDAAYVITAMVGDSEYVYYSAWKSNTKRVTLRKKADNSTNAEVIKEVVSGTPDPFAGLATAGGKLYGWTGRVLKEMRVNAAGALPLTDDEYNQTAYNSGVEVASGKSLGGGWWADCVASENAVFMFHSTPGRSTVHMYLETESGREIWAGPTGFTAKSISYNSGVVFIGGNYVASGNTGWGCVYAIPVQTLQPVFLGWFLKHLGMKSKDIISEGSYGNTVMFSDQNRGQIWVYDMDADGISLLDYVATSGAPAGDLQPQLPTDALTFTVGTHRLGDMSTFGDNRYAIVYDTSAAGAHYTMIYWQSDEETDRQIGTVTNDAKAVYESPRYDLGYPFDQKSIDKITVSFEVEDPATNSGLKLGQEILLEFKGFGSGYESLGTITSSTVASGALSTGRVNLAGGTQGRMFTDMKLRATVTGKYNGGVNPVPPPMVRSIGMDVAINNYDEYFDLVIRTRDESTKTARSSHRSRDANKIRTRIKDAIFDRTPISFKDGFLDPNAGVYNTHTVLIESAEDEVQQYGEGTIALTLRVMEVTSDGGVYA